jgi:hypothetical protein
MQQLPPLHLRRIDLRHITSLCPPNFPSMHVSRLLTTLMTDADCALPKLMCHHVKQLPNWDVWDASFVKQLDSHHRDGALAPPISIDELVRQHGSRPPLLWFHWTCVVKTDGTRKARASLLFNCHFYRF